MAPEMLSGQGYGKSADYWSLGCIAYEMLAGLPPFKSKDGRKELFRRIMSEKVKMPSGSTAEACKLLKGLLNRNVQKRLGAAKSTMFEVGGVSALKNEPFFGHLNWEHLANKQTEPPQVLSVQNDQDLKHFHQEFTDMALPRSVVLMSKDNFQAHHVESQRFRGFSFIHDAFDLPERPEEELETYWKSIEEDAVSLSDCASSKMGNDVSEQLSTDSPVKKRPPRKRKKNKKDAACIASAASVQSSPVPSAVATPAESEHGDDDEVTRLEQEEHIAQKISSEPLKQSEVCLDQTTSRSVCQDKPNIVPPEQIKKPVVVESWKSVGESRRKTVSNEYQSPSGKASKHSAFQQQQKPTVSLVTEQFNKTSKYTPGQPPTSRPPPWNRSKQTGAGVWGALPEATSRSFPLQTAHKAQQTPSPPPSTQPSPSSDWRHHSMSSRRQVSLEQQQKAQSQPTWPSLGGAQGKSPPSVGKTSSTAQPVLKGAWASKVLK